MVAITRHTYVNPGDEAKAIMALEAAAAAIAVSNGMNSPGAIANAAGVTWTVAQMLGGTILRSGAAGVSDTTPTAAQIVAAINAMGIVCDTTTVFELWVRNNNTGTLTITAGTNVTLEGTTTITTVLARRYLVRVTNATLGAEAVTLSGIMQAAV